jgi:transmembrane 9 superfamily protein 2/4
LEEGCCHVGTFGSWVHHQQMQTDVRIVFLTFIILNFFLVGARSSGAVPFGTMFGVFALWICISVPLCFLGAIHGFKKPKIAFPTRTNQIPRQIPDQPRYLGTLPSIILGGILPFIAIFIELYVIMNSIWSQRIYYVFGFLFMVSIVLIITCSEVAILLVYFQLCSENYHWWWRSFLASGGAALYLFLYGLAVRFSFYVC